MENKLKPKEKLFCIYYCQFRDAHLAASLSGFTLPKRSGLKLLSKSIIRKEIEKISENLPVTTGEIISGYRQLAFATGFDAFRLLFSDEMPDLNDLEQMNLLNISEIKRPKNGGIEIKFFDRLKALEKLEGISSISKDDSALPFYDAIEKSALAIKGDENGS